MVKRPVCSLDLMAISVADGNIVTSFSAGYNRVAFMLHNATGGTRPSSILDCTRLALFSFLFFLLFFFLLPSGFNSRILSAFDYDCLCQISSADLLFSRQLNPLIDVDSFINSSRSQANCIDSILKVV